MSVLAAFFQSLAYPAYVLIHFYTYVIFAAVILSWLEAFNVLNSSSAAVATIKDVIRRLTEPFFGFFRRFLPSTGAADFSPMLALLALFFLQSFIPRLFLILAGMLA